ncbi:MAG TPA: asparagine synthase (glutamine-hydrolyzing) [Terriglobales bacterium]|nr:asparagine synthase (glutamine-hydrolyzing) [Terriglobales bacterium]
MCGIAGVLHFSSEKPVNPGVLRQMCAAMAHRGPDDDGFYVQGQVGLGMRRLSIVDLSTGHQPITNEDETCFIVFNGEIYNHATLRKDLQARGHRYRTQSDTETIVHLYEEYGRDCVRHLRGMFAFAIWDARKRRLFIARDRLGIKPLYYRLSSESLIFGSEIKVLLAHGIEAQFSRHVLPEYLALGYSSGPETFYEDVLKLMPGHTMEVDLSGKTSVAAYWDLKIEAQDAPHDEKYFVEQYRGLLEQAVQSHLMSDVPLGVFLSGGLDSSAVAAIMTKLRGPVQTFSVGYKEDTYSELPYARAVARHLNSVHHEVVVSREQFFDALPRLIWHEDEPIVWPSSVPLYFVSRLARDHVKVVLTGEGSDETLGGYSRYAFTVKNAALDGYYRALIPEVIRRTIRHSIEDSAWISAPLRRKLSHTPLGRNGASWASLYFDNFLCAFSEKEQHSLLSDKVAAEFQPGAPYASSLEYWQRSSGPMLQRMLYTDIKTYLVELLMKQDNMSMAASIESRVPFLDHVLVEFAVNIPRRVQMKGLAGKQILKKAVEDLLPHSIIYRKKMGFPTPWSRWLKGPQLQSIRELVLEPRSLDRNLFKPAAIERLFSEHESGRVDNYDRIWRLLNLELWHRVCLESEGHEFATSIEPQEPLVQRT